MAEVYYLAVPADIFCVCSDSSDHRDQVCIGGGVMKEQKSDYEEYLDRYCRTYRVSRAEAEQHKLVQNYKEYCEEREADKNGVKQ